MWSQRGQSRPAQSEAYVENATADREERRQSDNCSFTGGQFDGRMADLALSSVEKIFKVGLEIKEAVRTARRNKRECRDIERSVARVGALLSLLNEETEMMRHPAMSGPLEDLAESLAEALDLVRDCQGRHPVRQFFGAGAMARELRRVHDDILRKLTLGNFAINTVHITITLTHTFQYADAHHPRTQWQFQDANEITLAATGSEEPYPPTSSLTELSLSSELEATTDHSSEENITGGGARSFVYKQRIMIRVQMRSNEFRSKAMKLIAAVAGVESVALAGDASDQVIVVGGGVDWIWLINALRKKVGPAILQFAEAADAGRRRSRCSSPQLVQVPDAATTTRRLQARHRWEHVWIPDMRTYGIVFIFLFVFFLRFVTSESLDHAYV